MTRSPSASPFAGRLEHLVAATVPAAAAAGVALDEILGEDGTAILGEDGVALQKEG